MSEKRFKIRYGTISTNYPSGRIFDNKKQHSLYLDEVVDLLNELNDENQELKRLIKKMGELGGFNKHLIKTICGDLE